MFESVIAAKMKPRHLVKLLKVSRVTASNWLNGHSVPHSMLRSKVDSMLKAVDAALATGDLPAPAEFKGKEENSYVQGVLRKHLLALRDASK